MSVLAKIIEGKFGEKAYFKSIHICCLIVIVGKRKQ